MMSIPVIDVFAGPGGLNEGFSSVTDGQGNQVFETKLSIEMEESAVATLKLRALTRKIRRYGTQQAKLALSDFLSKTVTLADLQGHPDVVALLEEVDSEVVRFTLAEESRPDSDGLIREQLTQADSSLASEWVLIGGPPCQAYSLAGRSRRTNDETFEDDHKHFLYKEYLNILEKFAPSVFVMENVKGMLSSQNKGAGIFDLIKKDLKNPADGIEYDLYSLVVDKESRDLDPADFIIRAENYGVPQRRHRVIIVGVRKGSGLGVPATLEACEKVTVADAIGDLPRIRSTISRGSDPSGIEWGEIWAKHTGLSPLQAPVVSSSTTYVTSGPESEKLESSASAFREWVLASKPDAVWNHASRGHMQADLDRYYLLAKMAEHMETSPKVRDLDKSYWPKHKNITSDNVPFADRFRVQVAGAPSTTVVSHIAKDGHYYIHPDPEQMRSLTVREAARLQSFPDDYIFLGNRTQQYTQVGNAVPPLLANKIAMQIAKLFASQG